MVPAREWTEAASTGTGLYPGKMIDEVHRIIQHSDHLKWLADIFAQNHATEVTSIGDELLMLGEWLKVPCIAAWLTAIGFTSKAT